MANRERSMCKIIVYSIIFATIFSIVSIFAFNYYPRSLKRVAGIEDITANDISEIKLSMGVYEETESIGMVPVVENIRNIIITDKAFYNDVLALFKGHTMRRRLFAPKVEYRRVIPTKPSYTFLSISFKDTNENLSINISNNSRFIAIWSSESDYTKYRLYGEGIDTISLLESVLRLDLKLSD